MSGLGQFSFINVFEGDHAFKLSNNLVNYFEIGRKNTEDYWLEGDIIEGEFLFNARLFVPSLGVFGTIIDNFPKGPSPRGWVKRQQVDGSGYDLLDGNDNRMFGFRFIDKTCLVTVNIFAKDGSLAAETLPTEFRVHGGPMALGRPCIIRID